MEFHICDETLEKVPHLSVDGVAPLGPNLSHWPGHRTPKHLAHELSTGICLRHVSFLREGRDAFAGEPHEPIVSNTHYDTDGALSLFAILSPDLALEHSRALLDAAACGDFLRYTTDQGLAIDTLIDALHDLEKSPFAAVRAAAGARRDEIAYREVLARLPHWLEHGLEHEELWRPRVEHVLLEIERLRADPPETGRSEASGLRFGETSFAPSRQAWNHVLPADRSLCVVRREDGRKLYRFEFSTKSWFDVPDPSIRRRVDLSSAAEELNALETAEEGTWVAESKAFPLPSLYFGTPGPPNFEERTPRLRPSLLSRDVVLDVLERHLLVGERALEVDS